MAITPDTEGGKELKKTYECPNVEGRSGGWMTGITYGRIG
jgi:hypothetical protein